MRDYILTAPSEQDLITALPEYRVQSEDGEQWAGNVFAPCTRWISRPAYDAEGDQTSPGETVPGYHLILRAESLPEAAQQYLNPGPADIEPVPAGGLLVPEVPQSVRALQGMRAIKAAGLVNVFVAWKAALDPIVDFEIIAFLDKAENWQYDDPILDSALDNFGVSEQKDALFILASQL